MTTADATRISADLVVAAGAVVTMDAGRRIIRDGAVAAVGRDIVAVGRREDVLAEYTPARLISASDSVLTPGLIDAHNHPAVYLIKGLLDDLPQVRRLRERVTPYEHQITGEEAYVAALATFAEMIRHGTTCFADGGGPKASDVARAARDIGIRGIVAAKTTDVAGPFGGSPPSTEEALAEADETVAKWHGAADGRLRAWYALEFPPAVSDRLCEAVRDRAKEHDVGIVGHMIGRRPVQGDPAPVRNPDLERYESLGVLDSRLLLAHIGWIPATDVARIAQTGTNVVHCPSSSLLGGNGWVTHGVIPDLVDAGVTVALGTDAAAISRFLDMVRVMYLAACAHKDARQNPEIMGAYQALEMATVNGARALRWSDRIGSLEPGRAADLTLFDASALHWSPNRLGNPIADLVYAASGADAQTVVIDGRVVMDQGRLVTIDVDELAKDVDKAAASALARLGIELLVRWPIV